MELTVKKEVEETVSIDLPIFFKEKEKHNYMAVLSDNQVITIKNHKGYSSYQNGDLWLFRTDIRDAVMTWEKIDEETFLAIHEDFLRLQSLLPVLIENDNDYDPNEQWHGLKNNNPDDLNGVL